MYIDWFIKNNYNFVMIIFSCAGMINMNLSVCISDKPKYYFPIATRNSKSHLHNACATILNSVIRKAIKKRKLSPSDDSAKKIVYLEAEELSKMDYADKQLENGLESIYDLIRRPFKRFYLK